MRKMEVFGVTVHELVSIYLSVLQALEPLLLKLKRKFSARKIQVLIYIYIYINRCVIIIKNFRNIIIIRVFNNF